MTLADKTKTAIEHIQLIINSLGNTGFLGHSGGKDSIVIHHLVQQVLGTDSIKIVHNVKPFLGVSGDPIAELTEMHMETLEFLYSSVCANHTVNFLHAKHMENWVLANKATYQIDGARIAEASRPGKSSNIIRNGNEINRSEMNWFEPRGIFNLLIVYPIFDWSDQDVWDYIITNNLTFSKEYLKNGEYSNFSTAR
jgi:3'-phosphoadenosine 5'-phosphosulfate sulfotransferase (PAPS reductase)/FAD synthetase